MMIGATGLETTKNFDIKVGCTYYMGASSSPDLVQILDITPNQITYARTYRGSSARLDRRIAEDLIACGCATIKARRQALKKNAPTWQVAGQDLYESRIGATVPSWYFDQHTVTVRSTSNDDQWRAAEEFGNVCGIADTDILEIKCSGEALARLKFDTRFTIVSETCTHDAPMTSTEVTSASLRNSFMSSR